MLNIDSKWAHFVNKPIRKVIAITDFCQNKVAALYTDRYFGDYLRDNHSFIL